MLKADVSRMDIRHPLALHSKERSFWISAQGSCADAFAACNSKLPVYKSSGKCRALDADITIKKIVLTTIGIITAGGHGLDLNLNLIESLVQT